MLINIRYFEKGEFSQSRLMFSFEETSIRHQIDSFKKRVSRHKKEDEDEPVQIKIPKGGQVFARLLPGSGKSFCFSLPASSKSDLNIVISPLSSLIRDQGIPFKINPSARDKVRNISYTDITLGKIRLLYVAPKSLISRSFRDDLNEITNGSRVNTLVIDKAHCISEWGHDFKPSYLRLPLVIEDLKKNNPNLTTIALTSYPGNMIRKDILDILDLNDYTPKSRNNYYRSNTSYQVAAVTESREKEAVYEKILRKDIPFILYRTGLFPQALTSFPTYQDPYAQFLDPDEKNRKKENQDPNALPDLSVKTLAQKKSPSSAHVMVHISLEGSLEKWLYQINREGRNGNRVHCVRLADIPNDLCEMDMQQNCTRVPKCEKLSCAFGRNSLCDYGKQHHLIQKIYPDMDTGLYETLLTLDKILQSFERKENPARIPLSEVSQKHTELALNRLCSIKLIESFFIDYREEEALFKIYGFTGEINHEAALAGVLTYLKRNDISCSHKYAGYSIEELSADTGEIIRDRRIYGPHIQQLLEKSANQGRIKLYGSYKEFFHDVSEYLPIILTFVHDEVREMQYRKLWNLKEYVKSNTCRYAGVLRNIQAAHEEWQCGQCDQCVPDMAFERSPVVPPPETDGLEEMENYFEQWMKNDNVVFEPAYAEEFIESYGDHHRNLTARAQNALEKSPRNIKALYLLAEFAPEHLKSWHLIDFMQVVLHDLKFHQVIRFYETSQADIDIKQSIFSLLDSEYSVMHTPEGENWLYNEARNVFPDSEIEDVLGARLVLNELAQADFKSHNEKLNQLLKEL